MIQIISRAPNDNFTFDLFNQLVKTIKVDYEAYYAWTGKLDEFKQFIAETKFTKPNVVIGIKDLLDLWLEFDYWSDPVSAGVQLLAELAEKNLDKNFIIFTSLENLDLEFKKLNITNIQLINWGGDITNQSNVYPDIPPVSDKNFNSDKAFISLNRQPRAHRLVVLSYLFGQGYNQFGQITFIGDKLRKSRSNNLLDHLSWDVESIQASMFVDNREVVKEGYLKFYNTKLNANSHDIYQSDNDNFTNFNQNLRSKYQDSFVEIVSESSFATPGYNVTEKTLNSIYACNFPIILGGVGIVQLLRDIGFDVFDDVIDHSYDLITNPFNRIINAIECNKQLLLDADYAKEQWIKNKHRFESNVERARTQLYPWYKDRAIAQFNQLNWIG